MRLLWLPFGVVTVLLNGCSLKHNPVAPLGQKPRPEISEALLLKAKQVHLYKSATDLVSLPFRDFGEVKGESCQVKKQDKPASISAARKAMQLNAAKMDANAVLIHNCKITTKLPYCYRQARCQGSALVVSK